MNSTIEHDNKQFVSLLLKYLAIGLISVIASLGTLPYGYHFAGSLSLENDTWVMLLGYIFASTATFANFALSTSSLASIDPHVKVINPVWLMLICLLVATPVGFICFQGYAYLPWVLDFSMSLAVTLANAGINYTAINNFILNFKESWLSDKTVSNFIITSRIVGFLIGVLASSAYYVVATDGLINLFLHGSSHSISKTFICYLISGIIWIPSAMLFGNSTQVVFEKLALFNLPSIKQERYWLDYVILVLAILSGSAFAQIMLEFFSSQHAIPEIFKSDLFQPILYYALIPVAYFASASVNYLALINLTKRWMEGRLKHVETAQ